MVAHNLMVADKWSAGTLVVDTPAVGTLVAGTLVVGTLVVGTLAVDMLVVASVPPSAVPAVLSLMLSLTPFAQVLQD